VIEALGGNVRARVKGTVNGVEFRSNLMRYGGVVWLGVHKATAQAARVDHGERVTVEMELDESPRVVEVSEALQQALGADPEARAKFDVLAFTYRKEIAQWGGGSEEGPDPHPANRRCDCTAEGRDEPAVSRYAVPGPRWAALARSDAKTSWAAATALPRLTG
jgi:hypothetical protein